VSVRLRTLLAALLLTAASAASAAGVLELLMFEDDDCGYCARWNEEIGGIYSRTEEGRAAPLRRIPIDAALPAGLRLAEQVHYTPTFVLMRDGRELGRITGYPGNEHFWGLLDAMLTGADG